METPGTLPAALPAGSIDRWTGVRWSGEIRIAACTMARGWDGPSH